MVVLVPNRWMDGGRSLNAIIIKNKKKSTKNAVEQQKERRGEERREMTAAL